MKLHWKVLLILFSAGIVHLTILKLLSKTASTYSAELLENIHQMRKIQVEKVCDELSETGMQWSDTLDLESLEHVIVDDEHRQLICVIPKVASGYFRQLFKVTDSTSFVESSLTRLEPEAASRRLREYRKFIFVRHPWERLWSAYNSKFVGMIKYFISHYRKVVLKGKIKREHKKLSCFTNVSFKDFINLILKEATEGRTPNPHWAPYLELCHPCIIQYDYIATLDSFVDDIQLLHYKSKAEPKDENSYDVQLASMTKAVCRTGRLDSSLKYEQRCLNGSVYLKSRLKILYNSGFLPLNMTFETAAKVLGSDQSNMTRWFRDCRVLVQTGFPLEAASAERIAIIKQRKRAVYEKALAEVPEHLMRRLTRLYRSDFLMFDYDSKVSK